MQGIQKLLKNPNAESPAQLEAYSLYVYDFFSICIFQIYLNFRKDKVQWEIKVRKYAQEHSK